MREHLHMSPANRRSQTMHQHEAVGRNILRGGSKIDELGPVGRRHSLHVPHSHVLTVALVLSSLSIPI